MVDGRSRIDDEWSGASKIVVLRMLHCNVVAGRSATLLLDDDEMTGRWLKLLRSHRLLQRSEAHRQEAVKISRK